jgi:hypothetical protein
MSAIRPSETELAKIVVDKLHDWHWEVYQEVIYGPGRADIIAVNGKIRWGIECKASLGMAVIEQAYSLKNYCHYTSIATPISRSQMPVIICSRFGIGMMTIYHMRDDCTENLKPKLNRRPITMTLHDEQKTYCAAGSNQGGHWTAFKHTRDALIRYVRQHPGAQFSDVIKQIDHHYSSLSTAKSCLRGFIGTSVIPELRTEIIERRLCVFLNDGLKDGA